MGGRTAMGNSENVSPIGVELRLCWNEWSALERAAKQVIS